MMPLMIRQSSARRLGERVFAYPLALSDETKCGSLNMATTEAGSFLHAFEDDTNVHDEIIPVTFSQASVGISIDDFIHLFDPPKPTHIKLDVDSTEAEIIEGGKGLLKEGAVQSVFIELEGALESERNRKIITRMQDLGYQPLERASGETRNLEFRKA